MDIVFDFGAVLFRWQPHLLIQEVFGEQFSHEEMARDAAAKIFQAHAIDADWSRFDQGMIDVPELIHKISLRTGYPSTDLQKLIDAVPDHLSPKESTVELVRELHAAGHRLFYLSNMPAPYARHLEKQYSFMNLFNGGVFSCDVNLIKPDPAIFDLCTSDLRLTESPIFIDDSVLNVQAATRAGWQTIHFENAAQTRDRLVTLGALT